MVNPAIDILLVEDDQDIRELMALHLLREGYSVTQAKNGEEALEFLAKKKFNLYIFDWMLPHLSGLELVQAVRQVSSHASILMVTAKMEPSDVVVGLEAGADDYIVKPFEVAVLMARVRALLRRLERVKESDRESEKSETFKFGDLEINEKACEVTCRGKVLSLTISEFKLLVGLAHHQGRVLTRQKLIELVQGVGVSVIDRAIDTHVFGLRKKLGECGELIETIRGVGYRIR